VATTSPVDSSTITRPRDLSRVRRRLRKVQCHAHEPLIMARHTDDNDKKPRPSQELQPHKPGDRPKSGAARPGSASAKAFAPRRRKRGPAANPSAAGLCPGQGRASREADRQALFRLLQRRRRQARRRTQGAKAAPEEPKRTERIAKAMARAGIASRREVERLIGLGKVAVNGKILDTPATLVTRDDVITVDGKPIGGGPGDARLALQQARRPADLAQRSGRAPDRVRQPARRPAARDLGRPSRHQHRRPAAADQRRRAEPGAGTADTALVRQYRARARGRITQAARWIR
jgi:23S rRNA pseudouridine2605 synthase